MNLTLRTRRWLYSIIFFGLVTAGMTLLIPSEADSRVWLGYSKQRLVILGIQLVLLLLSFILIRWATRKWITSLWIRKIIRIVKETETGRIAYFSLLGTAIFFSLSLGYEAVFIPQGLAPFCAWLTYGSWVLFHLYRKQVLIPSLKGEEHKQENLEERGMSRAQKRTAILLGLLGLFYFVLFIPINLQGAETPHDFLVSGGDEYVMYPVVVKMLSQQESLRMNFFRFFIYGDYIYGFPFYGLSALLLIPARLAFRADFAGQTQVNLFLLRQMISVLPYVLSAFIFTYLSTRLRHWLPSMLLFLLILTLPGAVQNNAQFWHPDSLNLFFIALTFFFLDRDHLRFGRFFFLAAVTCGLSTGTRLFGLFFILAVAGLLVAGFIRKHISFRQAALKGALFCVLMGATIAASNPYLFNPGEYKAIQRLSEKKKIDLTLGYSEPDPEGVYRTGIDAWWPHMTKWYGNGFTLGLLSLSAIAGLFVRKNWPFQWALFAWLLVIGGYLTLFVLVKSFQYMMPFLVPLYSAAFLLPQLISEKTALSSHSNWRFGLLAALTTILAGAGIVQLVQNVTWMGQRLFS